MAKVCCVCDKARSAYKCPVCKAPYCSATCCKSHKSEGCEPIETNEDTNTESQRINPTKYDFPTEDTVPIGKLEELRNSEELKECLRNPHVRNIMKAILTDENPTKAIALAMTEPIFVEVADACLKVVEPPDADKPS